MSALKLPQALAYSRANQHLCHRIGVQLDGVDMGTSVIAYDVAKGFVVMQATGDRRLGKVEPYWRTR